MMISDQIAPSTWSQALGDLVTVEQIELDQPPCSQDAALARIGQLIARSDCNLRTHTLIEAMIAQERTGGTYVGHGIAIPHVKSNAITDPIGALIHYQHHIAFGPDQAALVDILFGLVTPEHQPELHLQILAHLAKYFGDPASRQLIRTCHNPQLIWGSLVQSTS